MDGGLDAEGQEALSFLSQKTGIVALVPAELCKFRQEMSVLQAYSVSSLEKQSGQQFRVKTLGSDCQTPSSRSATHQPLTLG